MCNTYFISLPLIPLSLKILRKGGDRYVIRQAHSSNAGKGTTNSISKLTPEIESKILAGQRIDGSNKIIGGHSPTINDATPKYAVETIKVNPDGTRTVKYITQFEDGNLSK